MQPAEVISVDPLPPRRKRRARTAVAIAAAVAFLLGGGAVLGYALRLSVPQPTAVSTPSPATSPSDRLGRDACKQVFTPEILAPDTLKTMSPSDWQAWAPDVKRIADRAAMSDNREVARAGEDLQFEFKGNTFIPAAVMKAAGRLRDACDRVDYINIPGR